MNISGNTSGTPHEIHALSGAYVVDALDPGERARFEEHLALCTACRAEVASLREAAAVLPEVAATMPPQRLRDQVLSGIAAVRPLPPATPLPSRRRPRLGLIAAAAAVAAIAAGGGTVVWQQTHDSSSTTSATDRVIQAGDAQQIDVDLAGGASATVYRSVAEGKAVLVTRKLPDAPSGRVYQLWLQRDGRMVSAGMLAGSGDQKVLLDGDAAGASAAGITVEPLGGSAAPTTTPIALFDFDPAT